MVSEESTKQANCAHLAVNTAQAEEFRVAK